MKNEPQRSLLMTALRGDIVRRSLFVAAIIGSVLNLINQGDALFSGAPLEWWKLLLTYVVPYAVSTYGAISALHTQNAD